MAFIHVNVIYIYFLEQDVPIASLFRCIVFLCREAASFDLGGIGRSQLLFFFFFFFFVADECECGGILKGAAANRGVWKAGGSCGEIR